MRPGDIVAETQTVRLRDVAAESAPEHGVTGVAGGQGLQVSTAQSIPVMAGLGCNDIVPITQHVVR